MIYFINYNKTNGKILGFVTDINQDSKQGETIQVSRIQWSEAKKFNKILILDNIVSFEKVDFSTAAEVKEKLFQHIEGLVQTLLSKIAQEKGFDNIFTASTYITSLKDEFRTHAQSLVNFRDDVWTKIYLEMDNLENGLREIPESDEALLAELPQKEDYGL